METNLWLPPASTTELAFQDGMIGGALVVGIPSIIVILILIGALADRWSCILD